MRGTTSRPAGKVAPVTERPEDAIQGGRRGVLQMSNHTPYSQIHKRSSVHVCCFAFAQLTQNAPHHLSEHPVKTKRPHVSPSPPCFVFFSRVRCSTHLSQHASAVILGILLLLRNLGPSSSVVPLSTHTISPKSHRFLRSHAADATYIVSVWKWILKGPAVRSLHLLFGGGCPSIN